MEARYSQTLIRDLRRIICGEVAGDAMILAEASADFGGIVRKTPAVVVRPGDAKDVSRVIGYAAQRGIPIGTRAAGHSQGGQCLSDGGILLDMRSLNDIETIDARGSWVEAGAGVLWRDVIEVALERGLVPPVLTNNFFATLGGTHSTGGIGTSSFRHGTQADNCLALEVVTGAGEITWCSQRERPDLFRHVLCGLGQFGVITKVKHALRAHKRYARTDTFIYDDPNGLLEDMKSLVDEKRMDYVDAFAVRHPNSRSWLFPLRLTREVEDRNEVPAYRARHALRHLRSEGLSFDSFVLAPENLLDSPRETGTVRPWIDAFLPWAEARTRIEEALQKMPEEAKCSYALRPLSARRNRTPMLSLPEGDTCLGFGVFPVVPEKDAASVLTVIGHVSNSLTSGEGKRYLSGWNRFEARDWRLHYGRYWEKVREAKRRYDPHGVLNPGVVRYEETGDEYDDAGRDRTVTERDSRA